MARSNKSGGSNQVFMAWLGLSILLLVIDQLTKLLAKNNLFEGVAKPVTSFLNWTLVYNPGAAFSFLAQAGGWQRWFFTGLGVIATLGMVWMLKKHPGQKLFGFAIACILGGAVGNVIDRVLYGYVVDFLDFYYAGSHFPAFNVADSGITVGAACLILDEVLRVRQGD